MAAAPPPLARCSSQPSWDGPSASSAVVQQGAAVDGSAAGSGSIISTALAHTCGGRYRPRSPACAAVRARAPCWTRQRHARTSSPPIAPTRGAALAPGSSPDGLRGQRSIICSAPATPRPRGLSPLRCRARRHRRWSDSEMTTPTPRSDEWAHRPSIRVRTYLLVEYCTLTPWPTARRYAHVLERARARAADEPDGKATATPVKEVATFLSCTVYKLYNTVALLHTVRSFARPPFLNATPTKKPKPHTAKWKVPGGIIDAKPVCTLVHIVDPCISTFGSVRLHTFTY